LSDCLDQMFDIYITFKRLQHIIDELQVITA
jgi:hypothetical protein